MTTPKWKDGDKVRLKSGGPVMTVEYTAGGTIFCRWGWWFRRERYHFLAVMLKAA